MGRKITGASITLPAPFNATSSDPVDSRFVVETKSDLTKKETFGYSGNYCYIYEGMPVYVSDEKATYTYMGPFDAGNGVPIEGGMDTLDNWVKTGDKNFNVINIKDSITAEANRAKAAEQKLTTDLREEVARAEKAESDLATAITEATKISDVANNILWLTESGFAANVGLKWTGSQLLLIDHSNKVISTINGSDFIKDGMLNNVELDGNDLVFTFNTDSGKEAIRVNMSSFVDLYNGSNVLLTDVTIPNTYTDPKSGDSINSAIANLIKKNRLTDSSINTLTSLIQDVTLKVGEQYKVKDADNNTIHNVDGIISLNYSTILLGTAEYNALETNQSPLGTYISTHANAVVADNRIRVYNGERDINSKAVNLVLEKALYKHLEKVNTNIQSNTDQITVLSGLLLILTTGAKVTASCNPAMIYKSVGTNVTVTGAFNASDPNLIPKKIAIYYGNEELAVEENSKVVRFNDSVNITTNAKSYSIRAEVDPSNTGNITVLTGSTAVNARYPIYYGFGNSATEILTPTTSSFKLNPTSTASRTYTATNNKTADCYFYILVPTDISTPTKFSMGGAPASMNTTSETLDGIAYKVIKSGGIYAPGAKVEITAS